jgi:hypothetical protein
MEIKTGMTRIMAQTKKPALRFWPVALGKRTTFSEVAVGSPKPLAPVESIRISWRFERQETDARSA